MYPQLARHFFASLTALAILRSVCTGAAAGANSKLISKAPRVLESLSTKPNASIVPLSKRAIAGFAALKSTDGTISRWLFENSATIGTDSSFATATISSSSRSPSPFTAASNAALEIPARLATSLAESPLAARILAIAASDIDNSHSFQTVLISGRGIHKAVGSFRHNGIGSRSLSRLGVVQAVSAGGVAGIRRRADTLQRTVSRGKLASELSTVRTIQLDIGRIEIGFESLNKSILMTVTALFFLGLPALISAAFVGNVPVGPVWAAFAVAYYVMLPCVIYMVSSLIISKRCTTVIGTIKQAETRVKKSLLDL